MVAPTLGRQARVAVFPLENLSGGPAPYERIAALLQQKLGEIGFLLDTVEGGNPEPGPFYLRTLDRAASIARAS